MEVYVRDYFLSGSCFPLFLVFRLNKHTFIFMYTDMRVVLSFSFSLTLGQISKRCIFKLLFFKLGRARKPVSGYRMVSDDLFRRLVINSV